MVQVSIEVGVPMSLRVCSVNITTEKGITSLNDSNCGGFTCPPYSIHKKTMADVVVAMDAKVFGSSVKSIAVNMRYPVTTPATVQALVHNRRVRELAVTHRASCPVIERIVLYKSLAMALHTESVFNTLTVVFFDARLAASAVGNGADENIGGAAAGSSFASSPPVVDTAMALSDVLHGDGGHLDLPSSVSMLFHSLTGCYHLQVCCLVNFGACPRAVTLCP